MRMMNSSYSSSLKHINSNYDEFMMRMKGQPGAKKIFASTTYILTSY